MKIFTKAEIADRKNVELGRQARDAILIAEITDRERKEFESIREEKEAFLVEYAERLKKETGALEAKRDEVANAVASLEDRRRAALAPLEPTYKALSDREAAVSTREQTVDEKEAKSATRQAELAQIALDLEEKKDELDQLAANLATRKQGIDREAATLQGMQIAFSKKQQEFQEIFAGYLSRVAHWETEKENAKIAIDAERQQLTDEKLVIANDRAHLAAQQEVLKQAFDEARSKNLL